MSGALKQMAKLLSTNEEGAREFCLRVQECFHVVPPFRVIAECLKKHPYASPREIAEHLKRTWSATRKDKLPAERPARFGRPEHVTLDGTVGGTMMAHDPRAYINDLDKCPHGVLIGKKCALCDPEGWRQDTGWDY